MNFMQTALNFNGLTFPNRQATLTKQEKKLYNLIPVGKENAVQGSYLAKILNIDKRTVIDRVKKLRLKSIGIGSTTTNGYYRFKNQQEYSEYIRLFRMEYFKRGQVLNAMENIPIESFIPAKTKKRKKPEVNQ